MDLFILLGIGIATGAIIVAVLSHRNRMGTRKRPADVMTAASPARSRPAHQIHRGQRRCSSTPDDGTNLLLGLAVLAVLFGGIGGRPKTARSDSRNCSKRRVGKL